MGAGSYAHFGLEERSWRAMETGDDNQMRLHADGISLLHRSLQQSWLSLPYTAKPCLLVFIVGIYCDIKKAPSVRD